MFVENTSGIKIIVPEVKQIDVNNSALFSSELEEQLDGEEKVVMDLTNIQFMDSTGLGCIISALRKMNESRGRLVLCSPNHAVSLLFDMVRLSQIASICKDREEALNLLTS